MEAQFAAEHFDKVAATYDSDNRISKIAHDLLALAPPISATSVVLDNACGPGIITGEVRKQNASADEHLRIYATDISPGMIEQVREKNWPGVEAIVMDAQELAFAENTFTHSFTNLGIFMFPDPEKGAAEIYRTLKPGGVAVITSLKQVGWIRIFQNAQRTVRPEAPLWKGLLAEEWSTRRKLESVIQAGGFSADSIDVTTAGSSIPGNMMGGFLDSIKDIATSMITQDWSEDEKRQFEAALAGEFRALKAIPQDFEIITWAAGARK
ncbi:S-adenosyl-L-methionine-dependent methyltransferase [Lophiotrema nucula]|uniref:S-adenosyl-L-methionine-dependent methyltransferase n=1 Tax=Lophiotrema nucula TaxID=690887 RepID=A0A6A5YR96_9PLEO|nr:S-adenosyl-L-methionine-dependent methyltransferase [Lophiotrema nucula]